MSLEVYVIKEYDNIPKGTILQDCFTCFSQYGEECWSGLSCSMYGSYWVDIPKEYCEVYDEKKHDPLHVVKKYLAQKHEIDIETEERATLARLKAKYEKEN